MRCDAQPEIENWSLIINCVRQGVCFWALGAADLARPPRNAVDTQLWRDCNTIVTCTFLATLL